MFTCRRAPPGSRVSLASLSLPLCRYSHIPRLSGTRCSPVANQRDYTRRTKSRGGSWGNLATILAQGFLILPCLASCSITGF